MSLLTRLSRTEPPAEECPAYNPTCWDDQIKDGAQDAVGALGGSVLDQAAQSFANAAVEILKFLTTMWINPQIGDDGKDFGRLLSPRISQAADDPTYFIAQHTGWLVTWVAVLGILLAAGRMAWQRRGEPFREALSGMITLVVVVFALTQAINLILVAGDAYSQWIIDAATEGEVVGNVGKASAAAFYLAGSGAGVVLIVSLLAVISGIMQLGMMFVRGAMVVLLVGALPLAAAASIAPDGRQWFRKLLGWLIAFVLYKPVAATVYAVAFRSLKGDSIAQLQGIVLVILAIVTLPALMRFIVPLVSGTSAGGGGGALAGAAAGTVATGARMVPALGGGKSSSGSTGSSGSDGRKGPKGSKTTPTAPPGDGGGQQPAGAQDGKQAGQYTRTGAQVAGPKGAVVGAAIDAGKAVQQVAGKVTRQTTTDREGPRGSS